jgi:hypothetical protein
VRDLDHIEVDVGTEPAIEQQFLLAAETPFLQIGKIKETEVDRFLKFIDEITGKNHIRDMGLQQPDPAAG